MLNAVLWSSGAATSGSTSGAKSSWYFSTARRSAENRALDILPTYAPMSPSKRWCWRAPLISRFCELKNSERACWVYSAPSRTSSLSSLCVCCADRVTLAGRDSSRRMTPWSWLTRCARADRVAAPCSAVSTTDHVRTRVPSVSRCASARCACLMASTASTARRNLRCGPT